MTRLSRTSLMSSTVSPVPHAAPASQSTVTSTPARRRSGMAPER